MPNVRLVRLETDALTEEVQRARWAHLELVNFHDVIEKALQKLPRGISKRERQFVDGTIATKQEAAIVMRGWRDLRRQQANVLFPQMARYAVVALIFLVMEAEIHRLCGAIGTLKKLSLRWSDLRGDVLDRLHVYAVRLAGLPAPKAATWEELRRFEQIRHCVVHANGEVARSKDQKALRNLEGKLPGYAIDKDGRITLSSDAVREAIEAFAELMNHLVEEAGFPGIARLPNR